MRGSPGWAPSLSNGAGCHVHNNWPPLLEVTLGKHPQITSACPEIEIRFSESVDVTTFFVVPEKENMGGKAGPGGPGGPGRLCTCVHAFFVCVRVCVCVCAAAAAAAAQWSRKWPVAMWHESFPVLSHGEEHEGAAHFAGTGTACVVLLYHVVRQAEHAMQRVSR